MIDAKQRLASTEWMLVAMPQIVPDEEYEGYWFQNFYMLHKEQFLFEYGGHEIWGYRYKPDADLRFFVALNSSGTPVYINEVTKVTLAFAESAEKISHFLHSGIRFWSQSSVAFSKEADRSKLKGLATKIFWDYLASPGNAAITDSQQTAAGATFWKKILSHGVKYAVVNIDDNYRSNHLRVVSGSDRWTDSSHLGYDVKLAWQGSAAGKLMRIVVTTGIR